MSPILALLGGLLAIDSTSVGQFMISRPLVSGAVAGWALGFPMIGVAVGATLELFALATLPSGVTQLPDTTAGTLVAVACAAAGSEVGSFPFAIAFGLGWGRLGEESVQWLRSVNSRLVPELRTRTHGRVSPGRLARIHLLSITLDFARGAVVTATGAILGTATVRRIEAAWPLADRLTITLIVAAGAVSLGILAADFFEGRRAMLLVVAGVVAAALGTTVL